MAGALRAVRGETPRRTEVCRGLPAPGARVAALAVLAGVLLLAYRPAGFGQEVVQPGARVVRAAAVTAIDGGYEPAAEDPGPGPTLTLGADVPTAHPRYVAGEVIVKFLPSTVPESAAAHLRTLGVRALTRPHFAGADVLELEPGADPESVARALAARPDVEYAQASYLRRPLFVPNDPYFAQQWNLAILNMARAWDINDGASDAVVVAVIDSGVAFTDLNVNLNARAFRRGETRYPALGAVTLPFAAAPDLAGSNRFVAPFDFVWDDEYPLDFDGHGTHVAGTVGQLTDNGVGVAGVAFHVRIMPLKVIGGPWDFIFGAIDECCGATDRAVAEAIRYAVQRGARVINLSLGGPAPSPVITDALRHAVDRGAFVAIAAGNEFGVGNVPIHPAASGAGIDGVMSVGAVNHRLARASYSSVGRYVEIAAPGGDLNPPGDHRRSAVLQQTLDYRAVRTFLLPPERYGPPRFDVLRIVGVHGTSMAAPHVAGLAAMLMTQGITDPAAIEAAIKYFAVDLGPPGRDAEFGYGLINPHATLRGFGVAR